MNSLSVFDVKSKQFLLITKAGLAVSQSKEKGIVNIEQQILSEFTEAVAAIFLPPAFLGYDRSGFMRTKNYFVDVSRLEANDLHTGATLWRKYKEIRLILMNDFAPLVKKRMPGGEPPSGKSFSEILLAARKEIYETYEDISEKKSKAAKGYRRHAFIDSWYPPEWETFVTFGAGSPKPEDSLNARYCMTNDEFNSF
jgi:hypothetical protein